MSTYGSEIKSRHSIVPFALLLAIFTFTSCPPPAMERARVVVVFSDVTSSLFPKENNEVATLTNAVLDALPPGTRYYVYPVQIEALKLDSIDEGKIELEEIPGAAEQAKTTRQNKIKSEIERLYKLIKDTKRADAYGKPDNHTCILYTLEFAQKVFKQFDEKKTDFDLVYVSDMIEECNMTPMRKPVSLEPKSMPDAIKLAKETNLNLDLSHARVSMIIPVATDATYTAGGRPNVREVQDFWEAILMHCGFEESLKDPQKFSFSSRVPRYLESR